MVASPVPPRALLADPGRAEQAAEAPRCRPAAAASPVPRPRAPDASSDSPRGMSKPSSSSSAASAPLGVRALAVRLALLAAVWYSSAMCATIVNKQLMDGFGHPTLLSFLHLLSGSLMDWALLRWRGQRVPLNRRMLVRGVPVALALAGGKCLTYISYGRVPASLTHTVKASAPVFSVVLAWAALSQLPGLWTCLSLLPITLGVAMAAVSEVDFQLVGFAAALSATMLNVCQSMYTKRTLQKLKVDPVAFHLYTCVAAQLLLLPWLLTHDMVDLLASPELAAAADGGAEAAAAAVAAAAAPPVPYAMLMVSVALHYAQNLSAIYVLSHVNVLSYQVMGTFKRLITIIGSVLFFRNLVTLQNAGGMAMALLGFLAYGLSRARKLPASAKAAPLIKPLRAGDVPAACPPSVVIVDVKPSPAPGPKTAAANKEHSI